MNNLDKQYQALLQDILDNGITKDDRTGVGTQSLFGITVKHNMSEGFPLITTKKMYWQGIVTELLWFLRGDTNIKFLVDNGCNIWNGDAYKRFTYYTDEETTMERFIELIKTDAEFAKKWGELGPIYGKQWRDWGGKQVSVKDGKVIITVNDQITDLINDLKTNPDSRRLMVNAWNVGELDQMVLPPCHWGFQVYTREMTLNERCGYWAASLKKDISYAEDMTHDTLDAVNCPKRKISLLWNQRSADVFLGLPFNIASYGLLLHIVGELVNMVPDQLIGNIGDAHIYLNHIDAAREQLKREPYALPTLNINTEWWPTESGECGIGPFDTDAFFAGLDNNVQHFVRCLLEEDIQLERYQHHPTIKAPLNN